MAVMEVSLPSGFTVDLDTLPSLEANERIKVRMESLNLGSKKAYKSLPISRKLKLKTGTRL